MKTEAKLHEKYYHKLKERETGSISFGNSIIQSKIGIFNYPKGFSRKSIISDLISSPLEGWDDSEFLESKSMDSGALGRSGSPKPSESTLWGCKSMGCTYIQRSEGKKGYVLA